MPVFPPDVVSPGAPGDLVVLPNQYEYNGLLIGRGTPYILSDIEGMLGGISVEDRDVERQDAHGMWPGPAYLTGREISFDIASSCSSDVEAHERLDALERAYGFDNGAMEWVFSRPFYPKRYFLAEVRNRDFVATYDMAHGLLTGSIMLFCADPRAYSVIEHEEQIIIPVGQTNAQTTVNNAGNGRSGPTLEINGPATNPSIVNVTDGNRAITTEVVLASDEILTIDVQHRAALVNGADSYSVIRNDSKWWRLRPGDNTIQYHRQDSSGAQSELTITHRDVWL